MFEICKCTMLFFITIWNLLIYYAIIYFPLLTVCFYQEEKSGKFASLLITLRLACLWSRFLWIWIVQRLLRIFIYFIDFNSSPVSNEPMLLPSTVFSTPPRKKRRSCKKIEKCLICSHFTSTKSFIPFTYTIT